MISTDKWENSVKIPFIALQLSKPALWQYFDHFYYPYFLTMNWNHEYIISPLRLSFHSDKMSKSS